MGVMANAGKYKIIEYLVNETGYQAFVAVNVEKRANDEVLINRYREAEAVRAMASIVYDMARTGGGEFIESFSEYGALCAVFTYKRGVCLHKAALKKLEAETRLALAKSLMHSALLQLDYPMLVRNASLEAENIIADIPNRKIFFRRVARPDMTASVSNEQKRLAAYLPAIYPKDIFAPDEYWDFIDKLQESGFTHITQVFSQWNVCLPRLEQTLSEIQKSGKLKKLGPAITRWIKRKVRRRRAVRRLPADETMENRNVGL